MIRFGLLSELGTGENAGYARVHLDDVDIVSNWLALPSFATKSAKHWIPIEINSQVGCIIDDDTQQGFISIVLWSETDTPPEWANENTMGIMFADGAEFYYDSKSKTLTVNAPDSELNIKCKSLNVDAEMNITGDTKIKGKTTIDGDTKFTGDMDFTGKIEATGNITSKTGNIEASLGDVKAGPLGISLQLHKHPTSMGPSGPSIP